MGYNVSTKDVSAGDGGGTGIGQDTVEQTTR